MNKEEEIPKPVKEESITEDVRQKYLIEWQRLFQAIDPDIEVHIVDIKDRYANKEFTEAIDRVFGSDNFASWYENTSCIAIRLPNDYPYTWIIGTTDDQMFSNFEAGQDQLHNNDESYECEPECKEWKFFYEELCMYVSKRNSTKIPEPPKPDEQK